MIINLGDMLYGQQVREAASCVLEEWLKIVHSFYLMRRGSVHQVSAMNRPVTLFRRLWIMVWVWKNLVFLLPSLTQFSRDFWNHRISSLCTSWSYLTCKDFSNWINADVGWTASSMCTFFLEDIAKDIFDEGDRFISKLLSLCKASPLVLDQVCTTIFSYSGWVRRKRTLSRNEERVSSK